MRLRDIPSQKRPIKIEGNKTVEDLANFNDEELGAIADTMNSKRSPPTVHRPQMVGLAKTKLLKAITHWGRKKMR